ncbi:MAG: manganese efflux pump [Candidatus Delongbacteria bacterium]|nr:manganese efflux pump [Candidatus Delongbacteria bacterium]
MSWQELIPILLIAVGLSMDAFAVSISCGLTIQCLHLRHAFRIAFFFGFFQAVMPILGWLAGQSLLAALQDYDHWLAFILLGWVGGKMIHESFRAKTCEPAADPLRLKNLLLLAVATSIDALAVGLSLSLIRVSILTPALIIGMVTFVISLGGVYIGERIGQWFQQKIEVLGGIILIGIGTKILLDHLYP